MQYGEDEHYYPEPDPRPEMDEVEYLDALADGSYMGWHETLIAPKGAFPKQTLDDPEPPPTLLEVQMADEEGYARAGYPDEERNA